MTSSGLYWPKPGSLSSVLTRESKARKTRKQVQVDAAPPREHPWTHRLDIWSSEESNARKPRKQCKTGKKRRERKVVVDEVEAYKLPAGVEEEARSEGAGGLTKTADGATILAHVSGITVAPAD
jgi:hypothetical protein